MKEPGTAAAFARSAAFEEQPASLDVRSELLTTSGGKNRSVQVSTDTDETKRKGLPRRCDCAAQRRARRAQRLHPGSGHRRRPR